MARRFRVSLVLVALAAGSLVAAKAIALPPTPEPGFVQPGQVLPSACTPTNAYEQQLWKSYGNDCRRLHFAFGPILAKPGQNDALIEPVTIEKPAYSGYIVRFRPDLVDQTGKAPDIASVHLHHATWLNGYPQYGNGPFFAAGEEKTIATFPQNYGMHVGAADVWLLLYMVHNATSQPHLVWITYDVDYISDAAVARDHIPMIGVKPVWLDVQRQPIAPGANNTSSNPVYNVQRGFGHPDTSSFARLNTGFNDGTGKLVCTWPLENCARHDTYGTVTPQQGVPVNVPGADWKVPADMAGTLIGIGGHLHPGGIRDEVSLVHDGVEKPIFISDSVAWKRGGDGNTAGGPRNSWDFSMGVTGAPLGWKVKIKPGDTIRLNAVYDSNDASWYENMGIVVAMVAPNDVEDAFHGGPGIDLFDQAHPVTIDPGFPTAPATPTPGWLPATCAHNNDPAKGPLVLCLRGQVTHSHMREASTFGGCGGQPCQALPTKLSSQFVSQIVSLGFTYGNADTGVIGVTGIPKVHLGQKLTFINFDTVADVWHTFTRCKEPCSGAYGLDYPTANGGVGTTDQMDFDSTEVGYGLFFSPASGQIGGSNKSTQQAAQDGLFATFTPTETGVYTLYCRIHPSMRGAFAVVK